MRWRLRSAGNTRGRRSGRSPWPTPHDTSSCSTLPNGWLRRWTRSWALPPAARTPARARARARVRNPSLFHEPRDPSRPRLLSVPADRLEPPWPDWRGHVPRLRLWQRAHGRHHAVGALASHVWRGVIVRRGWLGLDFPRLLPRLAGGVVVTALAVELAVWAIGLF